MNKYLVAVLMTVSSLSVNAASKCATVMEAIGGHAGLEAALRTSVKPSGGPGNGGFDLHMWATVVSDDGTVCAVAKTGSDINDQWLGSRVISAQKANTANAFSLQSALALSTANLWAPTQPGGSLFGLQFSNPVDTSVAYRGKSERFGTKKDPMNGKRIGGVNVFGGGLALYNANGDMVGAIGVSGDSSCADHNIAWRTRDALGLDFVPAGLSTGDNIIFDLDANGMSKSGFGHPTCTGPENVDVNNDVIKNHPLNPLSS